MQPFQKLCGASNLPFLTHNLPRITNTVSFPYPLALETEVEKLPRITSLAGSRIRTGKDGESSALIKLVGALSLHPPTQTHTLAVKNEAKCNISNSKSNIE